MKNYKFIIEYDGTKYSGWQKQGNTQNTIQGKIEDILRKMTGKTCEVHGSGRTDAGVHARGQVGNFKCETFLSESEILNYINAYLPHDIRVLSLCACDERFHSRLNAKGKRYSYTVSVGKPSVFKRKYVYAAYKMPSIEKMKEAAKLLCGTHDFLGFSSLKKTKKSTVRTVYSIDITQNGNEITFSFRGSGFLYNGVRILAGTLYEIGIGTKDISDIKTVFETKNREKAGATLPPCGLVLEEVYYD